MRSALGLIASALAGLAAVIANMDQDHDIVAFFIGLTFLGGLEAWAAHPLLDGWRRSASAFGPDSWFSRWGPSGHQPASGQVIP